MGTGIGDSESFLGRSSKGAPGALIGSGMRLVEPGTDLDPCPVHELLPLLSLVLHQLIQSSLNFLDLVMLLGSSLGHGLQLCEECVLLDLQMAHLPDCDRTTREALPTTATSCRHTKSTKPIES